MTQETAKHYKIKKHIEYSKGRKSVCVSSCLSYFGIEPYEYTYTSSKRNRYSYENVLRKFGYCVRSRASAFKVKKYNKSTLTQIRRNIAQSDYTVKDMFLVLVCQRKSAHLIVVNGSGEIIIDTAPKMRWRVETVKQVFKEV